MTPFPTRRAAEAAAVSPRSLAALDSASRIHKLEKIRIILGSFCDLRQARLLDIGVGNGVITAGLAASCREATGVDVIDERVSSEGYEFRIVGDEGLPFADASFDVVVSNHVIQLMRDQVRHLREIARVLRPGGICYIACANRISIVTQPRYHRPLLGLLPGPVLEYLRNRKWIDFRLTPISWWRLRKLARREFEFIDLTAAVVRNPERYGIERPMPGGLNRWVPDWVSHLAAPACIAVLRKRTIGA